MDRNVLSGVAQDSSQQSYAASKSKTENRNIESIGGKVCRARFVAEKMWNLIVRSYEGISQWLLCEPMWYYLSSFTAISTSDAEQKNWNSLFLSTWRKWGKVIQFIEALCQKSLPRQFRELFLLKQRRFFCVIVCPSIEMFTLSACHPTSVPRTAV